LASRRDFIVVSSGRLASALIAIASMRIMTTLLPPTDYGIYALLAAFQLFCGLFLVNPVGQHINRHTHAWWDDGTLMSRLARYNYYIIGVSLFISLPVMVWWHKSQTNMGNGYVGYALMAGVAVASIVYLGTWNSTLVPMLNLLGFRIKCCMDDYSNSDWHSIFDLL
jgi:O-antigen/teichoic acid export membrane protein